MKIAYFITGLGLGGAELVTIGIANEMVHSGHRIILVYLTGENEHHNVIDPAIETIGLNMRKTPWGLMCAMIKAHKVVQSFAPDIVHSNMIHANIFVRLLRLFGYIPHLINSEHSKDIRGKWRMWAYRFTDRLSDLNTNVSNEATDIFVETKAFSRHKSRPMYNGIDLMRFRSDSTARNQIRSQYGIKANDFLWLNVGRLTPAKDQSNLLCAMSKVAVGRLIIVGKGELHDTLLQEIESLGLRDRVILAGAHSNMPDYYNAADGFVLSSKWEGFGIVLAEAMACELPVITTDAGGCAEVVDSSKWVVPVSDSDGLAKKMNQMVTMPLAERLCLGKVNAQKAQEFDIHHISQLWQQIYQQL